jgi:DNA-binding HxlR family transcriptional regulator
MLGNTYDSQICSIARALEVVGERWSLLILRNALFAGSTRYGEFQRSLGIATNVLQDRLDGFVGAGIMERRRARDRPDSTEYVLTPKGRDFAPALIALTQWGDRWAAPDGPPILYRHEQCGSAISVGVQCARCGSVDGMDAIQALPGPGMPPDRAERIRRRIAAPGPPVQA